MLHPQQPPPPFTKCDSNSLPVSDLTHLIPTAPPTPEPELNFVPPAPVRKPKAKKPPKLPPAERIPGLILVECDQFTVSNRDGRIFLELIGAVASEHLPEHRRYLQPSMLADMLKVNTRTLRKLMALPKNPLPHVRFGGRPRFVEEDVYRWAKEGGNVSARRAAKALGKMVPNPSVGIFGPRGRARKYE